MLHTILAVSFVCLGIGISFGQSVRVQLTISPHPSTRLSDWQSKREVASLTVTNLSGKTVDARISATLSLDGSEVASTRVESMPVLSLPPGQSTFYGGDILPMSALVFTGDSKTNTIRSGSLPEGTYELCIHIVSVATQETISQPECRSFFLTKYSLPQLLQPENGITITAGIEGTTLFSWSPVVPSPQGLVVYRLRMVELVANQNPKQAILNNRPFFERTVRSATQLYWPAEFPLPKQGGTFAWSIQAEDADGAPIVVPERFAEPFTITVLPSQEECMRLLLTATSRKDSLLAAEELYWNEYSIMTRIRNELTEAHERADVYEIKKLEPQLQTVETRVRSRTRQHETFRALFDSAMQKYKKCIGR